MNFTVVGAGAWGTAFALHLARTGRPVSLVPRRWEQAEKVRITPALDAALADADVVMLACPAQALRPTVAKVKAALGNRDLRVVVSLAKGLELGTHLRPSEIIGEVLSGVTVGSLSGPTNALGVARGDPSAMVLAAAPLDSSAAEIQMAISSPTLRVYTSDDLAGVEFGSCLKNIYAIAAGCCDGLKLGDNTKAALLTRALAEMVRVGTALGARAETFYGLSGFGDLVATCYGGWSRNREFGQRIGEGYALAELLANRKTVVEGHYTTEAFASLCVRRGIEAPILREVHAILSQGKKPAAALAALMTRELKRETIAAGR
jgi:glycerol-3-phosphate dehydrogenase (NAD(P)+)